MMPGCFWRQWWSHRDPRAEDLCYPSETAITPVSTVLGWEASWRMTIVHVCTDARFPTHHSAAGRKASPGSPACNESLLLTCQFTSYTSSGILMGPGRYQRNILHTEHLIACQYPPTVLLSQGYHSPWWTQHWWWSFFPSLRITCQKARHGLSDGISPTQLQAAGVVSSPLSSWIAIPRAPKYYYSHAVTTEDQYTKQTAEAQPEVWVQVTSLTKDLGRWREPAISTSNISASPDQHLQ